MAGKTIGGVVRRKKPPTQLQVNATPKTTGNAVTGTKRYTTPYSSPNLYSAPGTPHPGALSQKKTGKRGSPSTPFIGKWKQGAEGKWKQGAVGKWRKGGGGGAGATPEPNDSEDAIHGSAETGTTGFAHQYSKSPYRTSQFAMGPGKMEFGKSGTGKKKPAEAQQRKAPKQGKRKGRKAK